MRRSFVCAFSMNSKCKTFCRMIAMQCVHNLIFICHIVDDVFNKERRTAAVYGAHIHSLNRVAAMKRWNDLQPGKNALVQIQRANINSKCFKLSENFNHFISRPHQSDVKHEPYTHCAHCAIQHASSGVSNGQRKIVSLVIVVAHNISYVVIAFLIALHSKIELEIAGPSVLTMASCKLNGSWYESKWCDCEIYLETTHTRPMCIFVFYSQSDIGRMDKWTRCTWCDEWVACVCV